MIKWPITVVLVFAFAGGVFAGMPLHSPKMTMKCCDKARSKDRSPNASLARLRCMMDCSETSPVSSGMLANFSYSWVAVEASIASQIADLFAVERPLPDDERSYEPPVLPRSFQPRYIRYQSILI